MFESLDIHRHKHYGHIILNRPAALNALSFDMIRGLYQTLIEMRDDSSCQAVVITGAGDRAFCAGGDIKSAREQGLKAQTGDGNFDPVIQFFREEYELNKMLFHYPKPIIAVMHGITMGGGVGVAGPCRYKIATQTTQWAMPEVSIGFFPDIGAAYYLTRAPSSVGIYLGLTGESIKNKADLVKCGFATHTMLSDQIELFLQALDDATCEKDVAKTIEHFSFVPLLPELPYAKIKSIFSLPDVPSILNALKMDLDPWSQKTFKTIMSKSPLSVQVTFEHLKRATRESFDDIIARDLHLATEFLKDSDMYEGIRAMVVDKDRSPQWQSRWGDAIPERFFISPLEANQPSSNSLI